MTLPTLGAIISELRDVLDSSGDPKRSDCHAARPDRRAPVARRRPRPECLRLVCVGLRDDVLGFSRCVCCGSPRAISWSLDGDAIRVSLADGVRGRRFRIGRRSATRARSTAGPSTGFASGPTQRVVYADTRRTAARFPGSKSIAWPPQWAGRKLRPLQRFARRRRRSVDRATAAGATQADLAVLVAGRRAGLRVSIDRRSRAVHDASVAHGRVGRRHPALVVRDAASSARTALEPNRHRIVRHGTLSPRSG